MSAMNLKPLLENAEQLGLTLVIGRNSEGEATSVVVAYVGEHAQALVDAVNAAADTWDRSGECERCEGDGYWIEGGTVSICESCPPRA